MAGEERSCKDVKLHGVWASPFSKRVEMALKLKGIDYEYFEEDLTNKSPELLRYNPIHKKVPVLVHGGKPIPESMVILEYIDDTWKSGPPVLPVEPYERARARFWADFIYQKCMHPFWVAVWASDENGFNKLSVEVLENLRTLEEQLKGKRFFGGENPGYLDIVASFVAYWLWIIQEATGKEIVKDNDFPLICKWKDDFLNLSFAKDTLPPKDRLVAYFRERFEFAVKTSSSFTPK